jgi:hypothetical protein
MVKDLQFYRISFPTEQILASQERHCSMKLLEVQILDFNIRVTLMHSYTYGLKTVEYNLA